MKKIWIVVVELCEFERDFMFFSSKDEAEKMCNYLNKVGGIFDYKVRECVLYDSFEEAKRELEKIGREEADVK